MIVDSMQLRILLRRKCSWRATRMDASISSPVNYFLVLLDVTFFRLDNGNKLQSMSISDEEITSICAGANGTIFVAAEEIVYQVGMERNWNI